MYRWELCMDGNYVPMEMEIMYGWKLWMEIMDVLSMGVGQSVWMQRTMDVWSYRVLDWNYVYTCIYMYIYRWMELYN